MEKSVVDKIRRLFFNYDLTVAYALGEKKIRQEIMDLYRGDDRKPSQKKFIQAKIDAERFEIYMEAVVAAKKELENNVLFVLNRYTEHYKQIFWLHCISGKTYDEIAVQTGYSYEAVKKIIHKVKQDVICYFNDEEIPVLEKKRGRKKKGE